MLGGDIAGRKVLFGGKIMLAEGLVELERSQISGFEY